MTTEKFARPQHLVDTGSVAAELAESDLRVFDCSVFLRPTPDNPFRFESGRPEWQRGHVPGSGFLDLDDELSDRSCPLRFTMPSSEQFAKVMGRHGVGKGVRVILYSAGHPMWAARIWWMLRAFGFENAAVMDGGWEKWVAEGRPVSTEPCRYPATHFDVSPRSGLVVGKAAVSAALADPGAQLISALTRKMHAGEGVHYGRPGRIPGSACVPALMLIERGAGTFQPPSHLAAAFEAAGIRPGQRVITYCGSGIAAACDAFVLTLLGHDDVAIYDGSLAEWASDSSLPMETG
jgi:thiosulfate/3-mercaptopyruvate sulfurtransferase